MIRTSALTKTYPDGTTALHGIDLHVARGEAVVLLGSNGSGKSTLLRCLTRLLEPTSGTVQLGGVDVGQADAGPTSSPGDSASASRSPGCSCSSPR